MEQELKVFSNDEFGEVRTLVIDGEPWFVGKDVAEILGYSNASKAVMMHVDEDDKIAKMMDFGADSQIGSLPAGQSKTMLINESGLYSLILGSKLPAAKRFKRWVTAEVLPDIRRNGMYGTDAFIERSLNDPDWALAMIQKYKESRDQVKALTATVAIQSQQIAELQPKATYYNTVLSCQDALPISVIAKDYGWSAQQMNRFLHEQGVQYKLDGTWILYADYADGGYTSSITHTYEDHNGITHATVFTKWTQAGRLLIYELMTKAGHFPLMERELPL